jgi:hypothetical protein
MKACWIVVLLAGQVCGQKLPTATAEHGAFAFPDESGTRLIVIAGMPEAARVRKALCSDGSSLPVRFEGRQVDGRDDDGRQVPSRFDRLAGDVFRVVRGKVGVAASCFLVGGGWISGATIFAVKSAEENGVCDSDAEARLARSRGRAVARCFSVGSLDRDRQIILAEFARLGKDALASVVLMDGNRILFGDYPAEFRRDGDDLWRVDDGGVLSAEGYQVVFVANAASGTLWE